MKKLVQISKLLGVGIVLLVASSYAEDLPWVFITVVGCLFGVCNEQLRKSDNVGKHLLGYLAMYCVINLMWDKHGLLPILTCLTTWAAIRVWNQDGAVPVILEMLDRQTTTFFKDLFNDVEFVKTNRRDRERKTLDGVAMMQLGKATHNHAIEQMGMSML